MISLKFLKYFQRFSHQAGGFQPFCLLEWSSSKKRSKLFHQTMSKSQEESVFLLRFDARIARRKQKFRRRYSVLWKRGQRETEVLRPRHFHRRQGRGIQDVFRHDG